MALVAMYGARRHVENDGAVAARHRDRDRARAEACNAGAVIGDESGPRAHDHRGAAALRHPLHVAADGAGVGRVAHETEAHAGLGGALGGKRDGLHHRHRAEAPPAAEHERRGAVLVERRLCRDIDLAALNHAKIERQAGNAVSVDAAQIGRDQSVGDHGRVLGARAFAFKRRANEAGQVLVPDDDLVLAHALFLSLSI
jgi:hypothetical protein